MEAYIAKFKDYKPTQDKSASTAPAKEKKDKEEPKKEQKKEEIKQVKEADTKGKLEPKKSRSHNLKQLNNLKLVSLRLTFRHYLRKARDQFHSTK